MTDTANLALPCIEGSQAQKHVTHNEALRLLDSLVQLAVLDRDLTAPPGSPVEGQRWIVKTGATGTWASHVDAIAAWQDGAWQFSTPRVGWLAYVIDESVLLTWNGSAWVDAIGALSPTALNNMTLLGIGTTADATNPLSAKLNNTLFAARTVAEGGDGHLRYKLSKESAAKTLSFLFQDNYSGRAELGLIGDDDFHVKVSADGSIWHDAIKIDKTSGAVSFPNTTIAGGRAILTANRTYYVRADGSDSNTGLANTSGGAFLTIQKAIDTAIPLDLAGFTITIQVASGTYAAGVSLNSPFVGGNVVLSGDTTTPANVTISTTGDCLSVAAQATLEVKGFKLVSSAGNGVSVDTGAVVNLTGNMEYGAISAVQLRAINSATIAISAAYIISGGAARHMHATSNATINAGSVGTVTLSGTPAFSTSVVSARQGGVANVQGNTYSGSATGTRYVADTLGMVFVNGASTTYLPGSAAGTTASGGQYA